MNTNRLSASGTSAPTITAETKFMQNYRVAAAVHAGSQAATVRGANDAVEIFTTTDDGTIMNFYPDPSSDTGYSQVSTGMRGTDVATGVDSAGNIVVFAASGLTLQYVTQTDGGSRWSTPKAVEVPRPTQSIAIVSVFTEEIAGQLYVGVLTQFNGTLGKVNAFAYSIWSPEAPKFSRTSLNIRTRNCFWMGNDAASAAFAALDAAFITYRVSTHQVEHFAVAGTNRTVSVSATLNGRGETEIFGILDDGNAYHLARSATGFGWIQLSHGMTFRQIGCARDHQGGVELLGVNGDNRLYHWQPRVESVTGYTFPPAPIDVASARISVTANDAGDIDVFAVGTAQNTLMHLFQQQDKANNWASETVSVTTDGKVSDYVSYTTEITVFDAAGALLVNSPVVFWTSEESLVTVNGGTYFTEPQRPARLSTSASGMLSVAQQTSRLSVPRLYINLPAVMAPSDSIVVDQSSVVQEPLASITGPDLMKATINNGDFLLDPKYRTMETTDSLAKAISELMSLDSFPANAIAYEGQSGPRRGVWFRSSGSAADLASLVPSPRAQNWQLTFDGPRATFRTLTESEAYAILETKRATFRTAGPFDWVTDIGDFIQGVGKGVLDVIDYLITPIANGIRAAVTFIVDNVTYLFEQVITLVSQAFDVVEAILAKVKVFFERIFDWFGFIFQWGDILRTHEALAYTVNQMLGFLDGAASGLQTVVDNGITNVQSRLAALFQEALQSIAESYTLGGYNAAKSQPSPEFSSATANNIIYNGLIDNAGSAKMVGAPHELPDDNPISQLIQQLTEFADFTKSQDAFASAIDYFTKLGGSPDQIFAQLLSGLMELVEALLQAILSGTKVIVDALFGVVHALISALRSLLNDEWDIPFVSALYTFITKGAKLTTLDLISLIAAIPTTILYKTVKNKAPFPDQQAVDAFKSAFDARSMVQAAGLPGTTSTLPRRPAAGETSGLLPKDLALLTALGHTVAQLFFGGISGVIDGFPKNAPAVLHKATLFLEIASQAFAFPWFSSSGLPDCSTADGTEKFNWIYECAGVVLDGAFVAGEGKIPENWNDVGVVVAFVYGLGHLTVAIVASIPATGLAIAANISPVIAELGKFLRMEAIVKGTKAISLVVCSVLDWTFYTTGAVLEFLDAVVEEDDRAALLVVA